MVGNCAPLYCGHGLVVCIGSSVGELVWLGGVVVRLGVGSFLSANLFPLRVACTRVYSSSFGCPFQVSFARLRVGRLRLQCVH